MTVFSPLWPNDSLKLNKPPKISFVQRINWLTTWPHLTTGKINEAFETLVQIHVLPKGFFFSPPQQNHELFYSTSRVPVNLRHGVIYRHSFPVCCFNLLLFSSSRDRDGKAAKDEKGKDVFREGKKKIQWCFGFSDTTAVWKTCLLGAVSSNNTASSSRNIWVSGLSSNTKAADLKNLFGKYGKVDNVFFVCVVT